MKLFHLLATASYVAYAAALSIGGKSVLIDRESDGLQDIVTYDEYSLMVYGERIMVYSGEFHPFRLPVPDLWLDVLQKIKSLGFNAVSFYVDWALVEGQPGNYSAEGIFAFEPFFEMAQKAGIFLIARPGPYINSEASGGGFPGWLQRVSGQLRTRAPDYLAATDNYVAHIGATIAKAQITNGGPIILVQPENEYSISYAARAGHPELVTGGFPDPVYFAYVKKQLRDAGVVLPLISNDAFPQGYFAPGSVTNGTTIGNVDIYGHDAYPRSFSCIDPYAWNPENFYLVGGSFPTNFRATHEIQSPSTFYAVVEYQGGSLDPWGGVGYDTCADMVNMEYERVFYKNMYAAQTALLNLYMFGGGTNWGNIGHPGGYTSYDYGSAITETRELYRERVSEVKLQAQFLKVSPAYLTASVGNGTNGTYTTSPDIYTTPLFGNGSATNFYIVRSFDVAREESISYKLNVQTSKGNLTIPQLGGSLTLSRRNSKWQVTDYDMGGVTLLYSTAEILTWKKFDDKTVLVVYGGPGEQNELSIITSSSAKIVEGSDIIAEGTDMTLKSVDGTSIINWHTSTTRRVVQIGDVFVYILDRNSAYNYWVPDFPRTDEWASYSAPIEKTTSVIVQAGYLIRSATVVDSGLHIDGDLNSTVPIRVIGAPAATTELYFNDQQLTFEIDPNTGEWCSNLDYIAPEISLPDLSALDWKYLDDLPEIQSGYDDALWTSASKNGSNNPRALETPTSLYASDYGFHSGVLVYRGHFTANGQESTFNILTQGGLAYGTSAWINNTYLGTWAGNSTAANHTSNFNLPESLIPSTPYVFTVVIDNNGLDENFDIGADPMKAPRGILNYGLIDSSNQTLPQGGISWKLTGNLGGEAYVDKVRGPMNEGGLFAERQGFHQPGSPNADWLSGESPVTGIDKPGIAFYQASFDLDLPTGYEIPLEFNFGETLNSNNSTAEYRLHLWVNGYQFGKYINHIGPQTSFPVPQGILDYHGSNWIAVELWAHDDTGARLTGFTLEQAGKGSRNAIKTSFPEPNMAPIPLWRLREGVY